MTPTNGFTDLDVPDLSGKTMIVTGANTGIGYEVAKAIAGRGGRVLLACRSEEKAVQAIGRIRQATPHADLDFLPLDQADLDSVATAAKLASREARIDALINNAGVMTPPLTRTRQGFELQFGVNHLGCFALTSLLIPKLAQTAGSRIVVTSSVAHRRARIDWDDINSERSYDKFQRYAASKLANALFFFELDKRLRAVGSPVTALGCHPGMAATELGRNMGAAQVLLPLVGLLLNDAKKGAWPALQAATATDAMAGAYYGPQSFGGIRGKSGFADRSVGATDELQAANLWETSIAMTGINPRLV